MAIFSAIGGAISAVGVFLFSGTLAANIALTALSFGLNLVVSYLGRPKKRTYSANQDEIQIGGRVPVAALYGKGATKGHHVYYARHGEGNKYNSDVFVLSNGWCDGLEPEIYFYGKKHTLKLLGGKKVEDNFDDYADDLTQFENEQEFLDYWTSWPQFESDLAAFGFLINGFLRLFRDGIEFDTPQAAFVNAHEVWGVEGFDGKITIRFYDGRPGQQADAALVEDTKDLDNPWQSTSRLSGMSYVVIEREWDEDLFDKGHPEFKFVLRGVREYDPREDDTVSGGSGDQRLDDPATHVWTENPAVHRLNYQLGLRGLISDRTIIGEGKSLGQLDLASYFAAMNVCDEDRNGTSRYAASIFVTGDDDHTEVLKEFDDAMAGYGMNRQGLSGVIAGAPQTPVAEITADDLDMNRSKQIQYRKSAFDLYNHLSGQFTSPESHWEPESLDPITVNADVTADGRVRQTSNDFLQVTHPDIAEYLLQIRYRQQRKGGSATLPVSRRLGFKVREGEWVTYNSIDWLITGKRLDEQLQFTLTLAETGSDVYSETGIEPGPIIVSPTPPVNPSLLSTVEDFDAEAGLISGDNDYDIPALEFTWTPPEDPSITQVRIFYKLDDGNGAASDTTLHSDVSTDPESGNHTTTKDVLSGRVYVARATITTVPDRLKTFTEWATTADATGFFSLVVGAGNVDPTPPDPVTDLDVDLAGFRTVSLTWTNPGSANLGRVEIWAAKSDSFGAAENVGSFKGESGVVSGLDPDTEYWFWAVAVSIFDIAADEAGPVSETTLRLVADELADAAVTREKIEDLAVNAAKMADLTVNVDKLANDAVTAAKIASSAVGEAALDDLAVSAGKVQSSAITTDKMADDAVEAGKLASEAVGEGHLQALAVTEGKVAASAITTAKLADLSVEAGKLASEAVTAAKLAPLAVEASKLADDAVTETKISDDAITTPKLAANAVVADKIAANSVSISKLVVGSFDNLVQNPGAESGDLFPHDTVANGGTWRTVASLPRSGSYVFEYDPAGQTNDAVIYFNGALDNSSDHQSVAPGDKIYAECWGRRSIHVGDTFQRVRLRLLFRDTDGNSTVFITGSWVTFDSADWVHFLSVEGTAPSGTSYVVLSPQVEDNGDGWGIAIDDAYMRKMVDGSIVVDGTITATHLAADSVTAGKIESGSVTTAKLDASAVTADKIDAGAITTAKLDAGAVTATELASDSVETDKLAANSVEAGKIASGAVTTDKLDALAVTAAKIDTDAITADKILAGSITTPKLAAGSVEAEKLAAGSVETDKLASGSVVTDKLAANAVTIKNLVVGSFDNLIQNPGAESESLFPHDASIDGGGTWTTRDNAGAGHGGQNVFLFTDADQQSSLAALFFNGGLSSTTDHPSCGEGDRFYASVWVRYSSGSTFGNDVRLRMYFRDASGNSVSAPDSTITPSSNWQKIEVEGTAPEDAAFVVLSAHILNSGGDRGIWIDDAYMRRMIEGSIIVDGAVTAVKIEAESITSGKLASGSVTTDKLAAGSVIADSIASGAITADKMSVTTLDAITADFGTMTAGEIIL